MVIFIQDDLEMLVDNVALELSHKVSDFSQCKQTGDSS